MLQNHMGTENQHGKTAEQAHTLALQATLLSLQRQQLHTTRTQPPRLTNLTSHSRSTHGEYLTLTFVFVLPRSIPA